MASSRAVDLIFCDMMQKIIFTGGIMKRLLFAGLMFLVFLSSSVFAQGASQKGGSAVVDPQVTELVRRLLEANGTRDNITRIFADIIKRAPADKQQELENILKSDKIIDNLVPVYAKHFTAQELKELIAFYKSPVGAKNLALTPKLMTEVMEASVRYFERNIQPQESPAKVKTQP